MARFPHLADLQPPRAVRPLTATEAREYHAVRLALILTAGVMQSATFVVGTEPIPGDYPERAAWLRDTLAPLASRSPTVALLRRIIDVTGPIISWDDPRVLRRHLRRLAAEVPRLVRAMDAARRSRQRQA